MNPHLAFVVEIAVVGVVMLACGYLIHESKKVPLYPADYSLAVERVRKYVAIVTEDPARTDSEIITDLTREGVSHVDAHLLAEFVPTAFAWALLRKYGFSDFPKTYAAINRVVPRVVDRPLSSEQYFVAAQNIANEVIAGESLARLTAETLDAIAGRSEDAALLARLKAGGAITWEDEVGVVVRGVTAEEIRVSRRKGPPAPRSRANNA